MVVSTSHDGGVSFSPEVRVADDGWRLRGCPDSGPTLALMNQRLYIAWLTEGRDRHPRIQLSWSDDDARHFQTPLTVSGDILDPNHPALVRSEDANLALVFQGRSPANGSTWNPAGIFLVSVQGGSAGQAVALPVDAGASASYAAAAAGTGGRLFVTWTEQGKAGRRAVLLRARTQAR